MDEQQARTRLQAERAEVADLLAGTESAGQQDRADEDEEAEFGDAADAGLYLTAEAMDDSTAETLRDRLAAIDRALTRLDDGTYGRSVRSGVPIPDDRLDADPAAELTVEEARARP
jgi:DnaK suppressor protein